MGPLSSAALAASMGCVAGLIFWRFRQLRERGGFYYGLSWALSVGAAVGLVFLPEAVKTREWRSLIWAVCAGIFAGFGLAGYTLLIYRDRE
jgi:drug/metabolite transporter (DMT)-like permease